MLTHRQKQIGIILSAILFLVTVQFLIHEDVKSRHFENRPEYSDGTGAVSDDRHLQAELKTILAAAEWDTRSHGGTPTAEASHPSTISLLPWGPETEQATPFQTSVDTSTTTPVDVGVTSTADIVEWAGVPTSLSAESHLSAQHSTTPTQHSTMTATHSEMAAEDGFLEEEPSQTLSATYAVISQLAFETPALPPPEHNFTKAIVIPRTSKEDISWVDTAFGDDPMLQKAIYTVDKPVKPYILPANKGHEVMAYLTFIIDFYDHLPDVSIFMHAHEIAWHNNELLGMSSLEILKRLSIRKVVRDGYVNLRCHRYPSCPDHLFPMAKNHSTWDIPEEEIFADAWMEILPHDGVPEVVSQPCCGQFAVSRERIRLLPRAQYKHFRRWIMYTTHEDRVSGRVWEYIYQYIWLGVHQFCPKEHICYCDVYGICFGGEEQYEAYYAKKGYVGQLNGMKGDQMASGGNETWPIDFVSLIELAEKDVANDLANALLRGQDPYQRALEVGRVWQAGDGF